MEPNWNIVNDETEQDIFNQINSFVEKIDDFLYDSLTAFSYTMLRCLQMRLSEIEEDCYIENQGVLGITE
jgi:hypothetical protein